MLVLDWSVDPVKFYLTEEQRLWIAWILIYQGRDGDPEVQRGDYSSRRLVSGGFTRDQIEELNSPSLNAIAFVSLMFANSKRIAEIQNFCSDEKDFMILASRSFSIFSHLQLELADTKIDSFQSMSSQRSVLTAVIIRMLARFRYLLKPRAGRYKMQASCSFIVSSFQANRSLAPLIHATPTS